MVMSDEGLGDLCISVQHGRERDALIRASTGGDAVYRKNL